MNHILFLNPYFSLWFAATGELLAGEAYDPNAGEGNPSLTAAQNGENFQSETLLRNPVTRGSRSSWRLKLAGIRWRELLAAMATMNSGGSQCRGC